MQTIEEHPLRIQTQKPEVRTEHLLPPAARSWPVLALTWVTPMLVLTAINAHALWLCWGEMAGEERGRGYVLAAATLLSLAGGAAHCAYLIRSRQPLGSLGALVPLLAQCAFLGTATLIIPDMVPRAVQSWMLPVDRLLLHQWTFTMPGAFYGVLVLSGFRISSSSLKSAGVSALLMIAAPFAGWGLMVSYGALRVPELTEAIVLVCCITGITILMGVGLLRLLLIGYRGMELTNKYVQLICITVFTLGLPIGGLVLNRHILFPVDFQHPLIYVLTVLNAAGLMAATGSSPRMNHVLWLYRWATLPFTLYFFVVFLPYLPLSIPAMLAVFSGFLILAPTILLVIHVLRLRQAYRQLDARPAVCVASAAIAFSILPGYLWAEAYWMKGQLDRSMAYVLSPDLSAPQQFEGAPFLAVRSFDWLNEFKSGVYYPILTPLRSQILFNGLTLPDHKLDRLFKAFTAKPLPYIEDDPWSFRLFGISQGSVRRLSRGPVAPPLPEASLHQASAMALANPDGSVITRIRVEMKGASVGQSEFKTGVQLPEGAWVVGFALYMGDERIDGRIFEEKTALWVYRMIRDFERRVLCDPATLTYESDGSIRLQVFPIDPDEIRVCEIDVLSVMPSGNVQIGDRMVPMAGAESSQADPRAILLDLKSGVGVAAPEGAIPPSSAFMRTPFLHVFVDRSAQGLDAGQLRERLEELKAAFPEVNQVMLTLANFNASDLTQSPVAWDEAMRRVEQIDDVLPNKGGFLAGHALARAAYRLSQSKLASDWLRRPVWVILSNDQPLQAGGGSTGYLDYDQDLWAPFARSMPDVAPPLVLRHGDDIAHPQEASIVHLMRVGDHYALAQPGAAAWLRFWNADAGAQPEVYQPTEGGWREIPVVEARNLSPTSLQAARFDMQLARLILNPATWEGALVDVITRSKELNILSPATAFTVVENSAQWRTLEEKERQKLAASGALEFDETPEPSVYFIAVLAALMFGMREWIRRHPAKNRAQ